jgi:hypothetical protein
VRFTALALTLFVVVVTAEEPRVTFQFEKESVAKILKVIETYAGKKVTLDPEYAEAKIALDLKNVTVPEALGRIARQLGAVVYGESSIVPVWKRDVLVKLEKTRVHKLKFKANEIAFAEAIEYLRSLTGLNFALDPRLADRKGQGIELRADNIPARSLLDLLCEPAEIAWDLRYGVIFLATKERINALPAVSPWKDKALHEKRVDLPFDATAFPIALAYLTVASGEKFTIAPGDKDAIEAIEVSFTVNKVRLGDALALLLLPNGCKLERNNDGVYVISRS